MKKILVTGATGFIGKRLVTSLLCEDVCLYLLVRKDKYKKVKQQFKDNPQVRLVKGDILESEVVYHVNDLQFISSEIDSIVHIAAYYDIAASAIDAYKTNVIGTQNILYLASLMKKLECFHYLSTYAVNGHKKGIIDEEDLNIEGPFHDEYARSKMSAELLVRKNKLDGVKTRIYRPGIVVVFNDGEPEKIDGPYYFLKLLNQLKDHKSYTRFLRYFPLPYSREAQVPLLPVENLISCLKTSILFPRGDEGLKTYHLLDEKSPTMEEFFQEAMEHYGFNINFLPMKKFSLIEPIANKIGFPAQLLPHMYSEAKYKAKNFQHDFGDIAKLDVKENLPQFFQTAESFLSKRSNSEYRL